MVECSVRETWNTTDNIVFTLAFDGQECPSYSSGLPLVSPADPEGDPPQGEKSQDAEQPGR